MFGIGITELLILIIVLSVGIMGLTAVLAAAYFVVRAAVRAGTSDKKTKSHTDD